MFQHRHLSVVLLLLGARVLAGQDAADYDKDPLFQKGVVPPAPVLEWPYEKPSGYRNYAQELIFNKTRGEYYLAQAKAYYLAGFNGLRVGLGEEAFGYFRKITGLAFYEEDKSKYDLYERNHYKIEIMSPSGGAALNDFIEAEWYLTKTIQILFRYVEWDAEVATQPEYKLLLSNTYKCLVYCAVYVGNYRKALKYLEEFKKYNEDDLFIIEWEVRIYGMLVELAKKYDWVFVGPLSYESMKKKHREVLLKAIEFNYPGQSKTKEELKVRIYPELHYIPGKSTNAAPPPAVKKAAGASRTNR